MDPEARDTIEKLKAILAIQPQVETVTNAEGNFGYDKTNPVPVHSQAGALKYLAGLRCSCGAPFFFHRLGSCGTGPDEHIVDLYELQCRARKHQLRLYFDMYHAGSSSRIPYGLTAGKHAGIGLPLYVANFPDGLGDNFKYLEERRKYRKLLK